MGSCKIQGKQQHSLELSSSTTTTSSLVLEALILLQPFDRHIQHLHMCGLYIYSSIRQHTSAFVSIRSLSTETYSTCTCVAWRKFRRSVTSATKKICATKTNREKHAHINIYKKENMRAKQGEDTPGHKKILKNRKSARPWSKV